MFTYLHCASFPGAGIHTQGSPPANASLSPTSSGAFRIGQRPSSIRGIHMSRYRPGLAASLTIGGAPSTPFLTRCDKSAGHPSPIFDLGDTGPAASATEIRRLRRPLFQDTNPISKPAATRPPTRNPMKNTDEAQKARDAGLPVCGVRIRHNEPCSTCP